MGVARKSHGTGEGRGGSAGKVHNIALKAAETDATKRALATFCKPFGLALYRGARMTGRRNPCPHCQSRYRQARVGFHPDDTTPIPRPSRYRARQNELAEHFRAEQHQAIGDTASTPAAAPLLAPKTADQTSEPIDKSKRTIAEPKAARQGASEIRRLVAVPRPRTATLRSASSAVCATEIAGDER